MVRASPAAASGDRLQITPSARTPGAGTARAGCARSRRSAGGPVSAMSAPQTRSELDLVQLRRTTAAIGNAIASVIEGKPEVVRIALTALLAEGHLLIEDVPGVGKTML